MYPDYLIHYGVKGMKWGVRKSPDRGKKKRQKQFYESLQKGARNNDWNDAKKMIKSHKGMSDIQKIFDESRKMSERRYKLVTDSYHRKLSDNEINEYNSIVKNQDAVDRKYRKAMNNLVNDLLGEHSGTKIDRYKTNQVAEAVVQNILNRLDEYEDF